MKHRLSYGVMVAGLSAFLSQGFVGAQAKPTEQATTKGTFAFVVCVKNVLPEGKPWAYSGYLQDSETGNTWAMTGINVHDYVGKKVRIRITLVPSPNLAGQAGVIDPSRAIVAAGGPAITLPPGPPPKARVEQLRTIGVCEER
jgi:hypothetical protein